MITNYFSKAVIQIFCKAPIAGQVKTRLISDLTKEQAASIHQFLSERMIKQLIENQLCDVQLWCSPNVSHPFFQKMQANYKVSLYQQSTQDLGLRMFNALSHGLNNYQQVLLIGCDCPSLTKKDFIVAIEALIKGQDVVFAPAEDGGYTLVGMTQAHLGLFENMIWGNSKVFETTLARIKSLKLDCYQLKQQWDIDEPDDWRRYCSEYGKPNIAGI